MHRQKVGHCNHLLFAEDIQPPLVKHEVCHDLVVGLAANHDKVLGVVIWHRIIPLDHVHCIAKSEVSCFALNVVVVKESRQLFHVDVILWIDVIPVEPFRERRGFRRLVSLRVELMQQSNTFDLVLVHGVDNDVFVFFIPKLVFA